LIYFATLSKPAIIAMMVTLGIIFCADDTAAQSFLFPGAAVTFESGLSQTNTRGAAAMASNPANAVISRRLEAYGDMTIVNINYAYTREDSDPAKISLSAPPVNFGVSYKPKPNFAFGLFFTPRPSMKAMTIKSVPFDMSGTVINFDVEQKSTTFITAIGAGFKTSKDLSLGIALIETAEDSQIIVRDAGTVDDESALLGMRYRGDFFQVLAGFRKVQSGKLTIAGSYRTAVAKTYRGTQIIKGDQDNNIKKKGYAPGILAVGSEYRLGVPAVFGELRYEAWAAGKSSYTSGLPGSAAQTALNDLIILIAGGRLRLPNGHSGSASIGIYPHNVGFGSTSEDIQSGSGVSGVGFGEFDALDRVMFSASYRYTGKKSDLTAGFNVINGSRNVPAGYPGAGKYTLQVFSVGAGGSYYF
jgi:hypothetical protein